MGQVSGLQILDSCLAGWVEEKEGTYNSTYALRSFSVEHDGP